MKILLFIAIAFTFASCNHEEEVQWHQPGAKYKGVVKHGLISQVWCCEKGNNCAVREIIDYPLSNAKFMQYVNDNNIKGYFENEDWQSIFPELVDRPEIIARIIQLNPVVRLMNNNFDSKSIVIFQTADPSKTNTEDILFVIDNVNKMMDGPCPS